MALQNSSGEPQYGQSYTPTDDYVASFTQQMMDAAEANALLGNNRTEIIPHDKLQSLVRVYTPPTAAILAYSDSAPGVANLQLPDVLTGITVTYNTNEATGSGSHLAGVCNASLPVSVSFSPRATSQSSASIMPAVQIDIQQVWSQNVPVIHYGFYMAIGSTLAQILARLTTLAGAAVTAWPVFRPVAHTLTLKGQQVDVSQSAEIDEQVTASTTAVTLYKSSTGATSSMSTGISTSSIRIPPTIHGSITISSPTDSASAITSVGAHVPQILLTFSGGGTTTILPYDHVPGAIIQGVTASVSPTSFAATTPSSIPTSGIRLLDIQATESKWGYAFYKATVFDFANLV
jgi:hypothetical protein